MSALPEPRATPTAASVPLPRMTLMEHLDELRLRIVRSLIAVFVGFVACWFFA